MSMTLIETLRVIVGEPLNPPAVVEQECRKALKGGEMNRAEIFHYLSEALAKQEGMSKRSEAMYYANLASEHAKLDGNLVLAVRARANAITSASGLVDNGDFHHGVRVFCDTVKEEWLPEAEATATLSSQEILEIHSILSSLEQAAGNRYDQTVELVKATQH